MELFALGPDGRRMIRAALPASVRPPIFLTSLLSCTTGALFSSASGLSSGATQPWCCCCLFRHTADVHTGLGRMGHVGKKSLRAL